MREIFIARYVTLSCLQFIFSESKFAQKVINYPPSSREFEKSLNKVAHHIARRLLSLIVLDLKTAIGKSEDISKDYIKAVCKTTLIVNVCQVTL